MTATLEAATELTPIPALSQPPAPTHQRPDGLFVYGTLMPSHTKTFEHLTGVKEFPYLQAFLYDHILYHMAHFPGVVADPPSITKLVKYAVKGEFIKLTHLTEAEFNAVLARLDRYEGYPNLYQRKVVKVEDHRGNLRSAFVYVWNNPIDSFTKKGNISNAQAKDTSYTVLEWR